MIQPTVGRIVHYYPDKLDGIVSGNQPCAAIVAHVHDGDLVNLAVFDANGMVNNRTSVTLVQPGEEAPEHSFCTWMPYQVKKNLGSESGEPAAGKESI